MRQSLEGARRVTSDEAVIEQILRKVAIKVSEHDMRLQSPVIIGEANRVVREISGSGDPYEDAKRICNENALALRDEMKEMISRSADPVETAVRLAIAGNIIDFVVDPDADKSNIRQAVEESLSAAIEQSKFEEFKDAIQRARKILYLGDNNGEIVFDMLLIELLPKDKVTYAVRGMPVVNDVTYDDASFVGMTDLVEVIDNGSDMPGTILNQCSESFRRRFDEADLIISKGQGNYESVDDSGKETFFLLKAKCAVMNLALGVEIGALMMIHANRP